MGDGDTNLHETNSSSVSGAEPGLEPCGQLPGNRHSPVMSYKVTGTDREIVDDPFGLPQRTMQPVAFGVPYRRGP